MEEKGALPRTELGGRRRRRLQKGGGSKRGNLEKGGIPRNEGEGGDCYKTLISFTKGVVEGQEREEGKKRHGDFSALKRLKRMDKKTGMEKKKKNRVRWGAYFRGGQQGRLWGGTTEKGVLSFLGPYEGRATR